MQRLQFCSMTGRFPAYWRRCWNCDTLCAVHAGLRRPCGAQHQLRQPLGIKPSAEGRILRKHDLAQSGFKPPLIVMCMQGCRDVHTALARATNQRHSLDGNFSVEVVKYSRACKGAHSAAELRNEHSRVPAVHACVCRRIGLRHARHTLWAVFATAAFRTRKLHAA